MKEFDNIEDLFRDRLGDSKVDPPTDLWSRLDNSMNDTSFEDVFKENLEKAEEKPPRSIWAAIQFKLWLRSFMQFSATQFNVYYATAALTAVTIGAFSLLSSDEETVVDTVVNETIIENAIAEPVAAIDISEAKPFAVEETPVVETEIAEEPVAMVANTEPVEEPVKAVQPTIEDPDQPAPADIIAVKVTGKDLICEGAVKTYKVEVPSELSGASFIWMIDKKYGTIDGPANKNEVAVRWKNLGTTEVKCQVVANNATYEGAMQVAIKGVPNPEFKGKDVVCQGSENSLYYIKMVNRKDYVYEWSLDKGELNEASNHPASTKINWNTPGTFVVKTIATHKENGCFFEMLKEVTVNQKPVAKFDTQKSVANTVVFINHSYSDVPGNSDLKYKWEINNEVSKEKSPKVQFDESKRYAVELEVMDENRCKSTARQVFDIKVYKLSVEGSFSPSAGDTFIPESKDLVEYKLQIKDLNQNVIWETTELTDGEPAEGWEGLINGEEAAKGRYIWQISAKFEDGTKWEGVKDNFGNYRTFGYFDLR